MKAGPFKARDVVDESYVVWLKEQGVFPGLDLAVEFKRAKDWLWVHRDEGRRMTRMYFDKWLARAAERSYTSKPTPSIIP